MSQSRTITSCLLREPIEPDLLLASRARRGAGGWHGRAGGAADTYAAWRLVRPDGTERFVQQVVADDADDVIVDEHLDPGPS